MKALLIAAFLGLVFALIAKYVPAGSQAQSVPFLAGAVLYSMGVVWILLAD